MKKILSFLFSFLTFLVIPTGSVTASSYPIQALGNCRDAQECFYYCEIPANKPACWSYGEYVLHKNVLGDSTTSGEEQAKAHGITFPIAQLGNCASVQECMTYCNKIENRQACTDFANQKGLTQQNQNQNSNTQQANEVNKDKLLADAKQMLGCDSEEACKSFCNSPSNYQKCQNFFRQEGLGTQKPTMSGSQNQNSPDQSQAVFSQDFCSNPANKQKCTSYGAACSTFCSKNPDLCHTSGGSFGNTDQSVRPSSNSGSSLQGCTNKQDCMEYCRNHPDSCPGFPRGVQISNNPVPISGFPSNVSGVPHPSCIPRPSCLNSTPRCMIAEPAGGWCPQSTNE